ncbi:MAG: DUF2948 family protein [Azospirillaceae bacterium]|nr:DUF2948 family protein [Azospirillaceae bacterium]
MTKARPLKLRAIDAEDLKVISAALQDAIIPIGDMTYLSDEQCFALVANRFKWEDCDDIPLVPRDPAAGPLSDGDVRFAEDAPFERTNCGVCFSGITGVKCRGIDLHDRRQFLLLLAVVEENGRLFLHFAGDGCIRLETGNWSCRLEDIGDPWPTGLCPCHVTTDEPEPSQRAQTA